MDWTAVRARLEAMRASMSDTALEAERTQRILARRAELLARKPEELRAFAPEDALLVFQAAGQRYAFRVIDVAEVIAHAKLSLVPGAPPVVAGLTQVRGDIVPVYSVASLLGGPPSAGDSVVLIRIGTKTLGLLVDSIEGTRTEKPRHGEGALPAGVLWRTEDLVSVLDPALLLAKEE